MLEAKSGVWDTFCPRGCLPSADLPVPLAINHRSLQTEGASHL